MSLYNTMVYLYLLGKQNAINFYNKIIINIIGFNDMRALIDNKQKNIIFTYLLFSFITKFVNFFDYLKNKLIVLRNKIDINASKIQLTKITNQGEKTIIIDTEFVVVSKKLTLEDISNRLPNIQLDDVMINCIFLNFDLVDKENNTVCLKEFITKYKDLDEQYHHTLKNILIFNNIEYCENSIINIKLVKNKKIMTFDMSFKDVGDKHINYFIKLDK